MEIVECIINLNAEITGEKVIMELKPRLASNLAIHYLLLASS